jgi:hypothetical protein
MPTAFLKTVYAYPAYGYAVQHMHYYNAYLLNSLFISWLHNPLGTSALFTTCLFPSIICLSPAVNESSRIRL